MSDTFDHWEDAMRDDEGREGHTVTCKRCGATELCWEIVTAPDGRSERPVLFDTDGRQHHCQPSADDFEVVA